jgi:preprotein translocase subunit SecF
MSEKDINEDKIDKEDKTIDNEPRKRKRKRKTTTVVDEDTNNDNSELKEQKSTGVVAETLANSRMYLFIYLSIYLSIYLWNIFSNYISISISVFRYCICRRIAIYSYRKTG